MKFCWISSILLNVTFAAESAKFEYATYINHQLDNHSTGTICAKVPRQLLLIPDDKYQPYILIKADKLQLIDKRLEQVTELQLSDQAFFKLFHQQSRLTNTCVTQDKIKHCIKFYKVRQANCKLDYKIPENFEYIRS